MQKIKFTTLAGSITFADDELQRLEDGTTWVPFYLVDFDGNSQGITQDAVSCIGMAGQHIIGQQLAPKSIKVTLSFDGRGFSGSEPDGNAAHSGGDKAMYYFRRYVLTHFPLMEVGELEYTNNGGTYTINCRMSEYPVVERKSGTMCLLSFYLVADYPYWYRTVTGNVYTATFDDPASVNVLTSGDIASPIIGTITCVTPITGNSTGTFFKLWQYEGGTARMAFVQNLSAGQKIKFNTGLNNETYVKLIDTDESESYANNYVDYRNSDLLVNNVGTTKWRLSLYGTAGEYTIQMEYQNLYRAV